MFSQCCSCFFGRSEPLLERLLEEQQTRQYIGINYQLSISYDFRASSYFEEFLFTNPLTTNILGGWKVHISLNPANIENIARAWTEIIIPELAACRIREFKIAREEHIPMVANGSEGQGKLITVYLRHNPELCVRSANHVNLIRALNRIEEGLIV